MNAVRYVIGVELPDSRRLPGRESVPASDRHAVEAEGGDQALCGKRVSVKMLEQNFEQEVGLCRPCHEELLRLKSR